MDKRKVLSKLLPMIVLVSVSIAAGVTGATVIHSMQLENPIKTPVVEGGVTENLDQGAKEVSFTNNGEADVFLRVAFAQSWVAQDGTVLPNHITDASGQSLPAAVPSLSLDGNWESGEDGWYYYKKVLPGSASGIRDRGIKMRSINSISQWKSCSPAMTGMSAGRLCSGFLTGTFQ